MANNNLNIIVKIWDYWIEDSIDRGYEPMKFYCIMQIANELSFHEIEVTDA